MTSAEKERVGQACLTYLHSSLVKFGKTRVLCRRPGTCACTKAPVLKDTLPTRGADDLRSWSEGRRPTKVSSCSLETEFDSSSSAAAASRLACGPDAIGLAISPVPTASESRDGGASSTVDGVTLRRLAVADQAPPAVHWEKGCSLKQRQQTCKPRRHRFPAFANRHPSRLN